MVLNPARILLVTITRVTNEAVVADIADAQQNPVLGLVLIVAAGHPAARLQAHPLEDTLAEVITDVIMCSVNYALRLYNGDVKIFCF